MPKQKEKFVAVCPKCNSRDVTPYFSNPVAAATGMFNVMKECHKCGYAGALFPEVAKRSGKPRL